MKTRRAFTLLELLVVVAIIGVLVAVMTPALEKANERARLTTCSSNLHQIAIALNTYAGEFGNSIPLGLTTPSTLDPARPWSSMGSNQIWVASLTRYDGLGILTPPAGGSWLTDARVLVCPFDQDSSLKSDLPKMLGGTADVYGSYAYRRLEQRGSNVLLLPGNNGVNQPARAIVLDWQADGPAPYAHSSHDSGEFLNVMYDDGHIQYFPNDDRALGAGASDFDSMPGSYLHRLDQVWVTADWAETNSLESAPHLP